MSFENEELNVAIDNWLKWNLKDSPDYLAIQRLVEDKDEATLVKLLCKFTKFGTAGIRANMGPGFSQLNDLVIIQTNQGLANYLLNNVEGDEYNSLKESGIVIGFDGRHNSERWAKLSATVFLKAGFKVYLYSKMTPTPWVPYAVKYYKATVGIMITASHNPKNDNGYKCYWKNGAQILSPHDKGIQASIMESLVPINDAFNIDLTPAEKLIDPFEEITREYMNVVGKNLILDLEANKKSDIKLVYTAMHGVAANFVDLIYNEAGFNTPIHVMEQREPNPDFPTVPFPNPEEGKCALNLAMETADNNDVKVIIANDPDGDRLGIAEKTESEGWRVLTGNEMGTLLGWFQFHFYSTKHPEIDPSKYYYVASTVSSKMLKAIANAEGMNFEETLTGFKWMANKAIDLEAEGNTVLMAYEESIGYMIGTHVLDKDGVLAALRVAELLTYLKEHENGISLSEKLIQLYEKYGYHCSENSYFINPNPAKAEEIFNRLRKDEHYPESILNGEYKIEHVRDLTTGYDSSTPDKKATLPVDSSIQMITFTLMNGFVVTLRTSGTEPKIKYYGEYCANPESKKDWSEIKRECKIIIKAIIDEFLEPDRNGLKYPGSS